MNLLIFLFRFCGVIISTNSRFHGTEKNQKLEKTKSVNHTLNKKYSKNNVNMVDYCLKQLKMNNTEIKSTNEEFLKIQEFSCNEIFKQSNSKTENDCVAREIKEYKSRSLYIHLKTLKNICIIEDCYELSNGRCIKKKFKKACSYIIKNYTDSDPIIDGYLTARLIYRSRFFDAFIKNINSYINFKSHDDFVDIDSINQHLKNVKGADVIYTNLTVAEKALKVLRLKSLTKAMVSENIAKLIVFASRRDIRFHKSIMVNLIDFFKKNKILYEAEGLIDDDNNPSCIVYLNTNYYLSDIGNFYGVYTSLEMKFGIMLQSIICSVKIGLLCFIFNT